MVMGKNKCLLLWENFFWDLLFMSPDSKVGEAPLAYCSLPKSPEELCETQLVCACSQPGARRIGRAGFPAVHGTATEHLPSLLQTWFCHSELHFQVVSGAFLLLLLGTAELILMGLLCGPVTIPGKPVSWNSFPDLTPSSCLFSSVFKIIPPPPPASTFRYLVLPSKLFWEKSEIFTFSEKVPLWPCCLGQAFTFSRKSVFNLNYFPMTDIP